jgi:serine/threonine protein kinase
MIARKLPFDDDDIPTLMNKVRIGHYEMPLSVQEEARDLISLCLVKDPSERITVSSQSDLQLTLTGFSSSARSSPSCSRTHSSSSRSTLRLTPLSASSSGSTLRELHTK